MTVTSVEMAAYRWIKHAVGNDVAVIWYRPNAPRPKQTYVSLHLIQGPGKLGRDHYGPANARAETVQRIFFVEIPDAGSWQIAHDGEQTEHLGYDVDAPTVQAALRKVPGMGGVRVTGDFEDGFRLLLEGVAEPELVVISNSLTADEEPIEIAVDDLPEEAEKLFRLSGPRSYTLSVNAYGDDAHRLISDLQTSVEDPACIAIVHAHNVTVTGASPARDIAAMLDTRWEPRWQIDFDLLATEDRLIEQDTIEHIQVSSEVGGHQNDIEVDAP